jgi:hypothetical protein
MRHNRVGTAHGAGSIKHRRLLLGSLPLAALLLFGCAAMPAPSPQTAGSASATPTAEETPEPAVAASLRFSGSAAESVDADGATIASVPFDEGAAAVVDLLTTTSGIAPETAVEEEGCASPHTSYQWDGVALTAWTGSSDFIVGFSAAALGSVRLETTGGFTVGDDITAFAAAAPAENVGHPNDTDTVVAFDVVSRTSHDAYTSPVGAVGYAVDGVLTSLMTPGEWSAFYC